MPFKFTIKIMTIFLLLFLSACSTTKSSHIACDFVGGAAGNAVDRHENKGKSDIHGNTLKNKENSDLSKGIFSILSGAATRLINSNKSEPCT
ncbi:MAG: hypothetical protein ACPG52_05735 [Cognaticolwellia sp.]